MLLMLAWYVYTCCCCCLPLPHPPPHPPPPPPRRFIIDTLAVYVLRDGCDLEQLVMAREQRNPEYAFLFDLACAEHAYYRWVVLACCAPTAAATAVAILAAAELWYWLASLHKRDTASPQPQPQPQQMPAAGMLTLTHPLSPLPAGGGCTPLQKVTA
jgi:hypothetical protein